MPRSNAGRRTMVGNISRGHLGHRISRYQTLAPPGTGIRDSQLVEMHDGTVVAESPGIPLPPQPIKFSVRARMTMVRGQAQPPSRLNRVSRHALAFGIHEPKVVLTLGVPLPGSEAQPLCCLSSVPRDAFTEDVHLAEEGLSLYVRAAASASSSAASRYSRALATSGQG